MDTLKAKVDPYAGSYVRRPCGMATVVSSKETEPDGHGGFMIDLVIEYIQGGRRETLANLPSKWIEDSMVNAELDAWLVYEADLEKWHGRRRKPTWVNCPKCGPLTTVPGGDSHAVERIMKSHNSIHHSDN